MTEQKSRPDSQILAAITRPTKRTDSQITIDVPGPSSSGFPTPTTPPPPITPAKERTEATIDFSPADNPAPGLEWDNITYRIPLPRDRRRGKQAEKRTLLLEVSGEAKRGELVAIMGSR